MGEHLLAEGENGNDDGGYDVGRMQIRRLHVNTLLGSNARVSDIGKPRTDIIWGCVAEMITMGLHVNKDMVLTTSHLELLRARGKVAQEGAPEGEAHRVELQGSIVAWLKENEEKKGY